MRDAVARMADLVLFDFDGTLADSLEVALAVYNQIAPELGVPLLSADDTRLRKMSPREALAATDIPLWKLPRLMHAVRSGMHARMHEVSLFPGVPEALRALSAAGLRAGVVSSNARENIDACLARHGVHGLEILGTGTSLFGKAAALKKALKREGIAPADAIYVGDEVRDVAAATEARMRSVAVSWGFADRQALVDAKPTAVADTPDALARLLVEGLPRA